MSKNESILNIHTESSIDIEDGSLKLLYKISNAIIDATSQKSLLDVFIEIYVNEFNANAGIIFLASDEGLLEASSSYGFGTTNELSYEILSSRSTLNLFQNYNKITVQPVPVDNKNGDHISALSAPILSKGKVLGIVNLFFSASVDTIDSATQILITEANRLLSRSIVKFEADQTLIKKLIQEERNMIANELHDSLAQTLASLRFHVRILDETLQSTSEYTAITNIEKVEQSLESAYRDLRGLISLCKAPIEQQGIIHLLEDIVYKFREETQTQILLQCECQNTDLPSDIELNIYRIVQEALTNIKKHTKANIVRVLFQCNDKGNYNVLIENDGKGFNTNSLTTLDGRHLGLQIMRERARHLGGELRIESEKYEGTRIELNFFYKSE